MADLKEKDLQLLFKRGWLQDNTPVKWYMRLKRKEESMYVYGIYLTIDETQVPEEYLDELIDGNITEMDEEVHLIENDFCEFYIPPNNCELRGYRWGSSDFRLFADILDNVLSWHYRLKQYEELSKITQFL